MLIPCYCPFDLSKSLTRFFLASILATIAIFCGIIPEFSIFSGYSSQLSFGSSAYTQDFSDDQITRYARAYLQIESNRKQALETIIQIMGKSPPPIVCNQRDTLRNLPSEAQKIAVNFCNTSKKIVEESGLSSSQFNAITERLKSDEVLKKRVERALVQVQREGK